MDFTQMPMGFGMALAMNFPAMNAYSAMTDDQKQAILNKACNAHTQEEMHKIVNNLASRMQ